MTPSLNYPKRYRIKLIHDTVEYEKERSAFVKRHGKDGEHAAYYHFPNPTFIGDHNMEFDSFEQAIAKAKFFYDECNTFWEYGGPSRRELCHMLLLDSYGQEITYCFHKFFDKHKHIDFHPSGLLNHEYGQSVSKTTQ